jgi:hypothetical protein
MWQEDCAIPDVYATSFTLLRSRSTSPATLVVAAIQEWVDQRCPEAPRFQLGETIARRTALGHILRWEPYDDERRTFIEFLWRHAHGASPDITWSHRLTYLSDHGEGLLSLVVSNNGPDAESPGALLTQPPRLVQILREHFDLICDGFPDRANPERLEGQSMFDVVNYELLDPARRHPILMLSPSADGTYPVPPIELAREFASLSKVYAMESPDTTFALTDALGRRELSCFFGAARLYYPGFARDADPMSHPLILPRRLTSPDERDALQRALALMTVSRYREDPRLTELRDARALAAEEARRATRERGPDDRPRPTAPDDYEDFIEEILVENAALAGEAEDLRVRLQTEQERMVMLEKERRRLHYLVRELGGRGSG